MEMAGEGAAIPSGEVKKGGERRVSNPPFEGSFYNLEVQNTKIMNLRCGRSI